MCLTCERTFSSSRLTACFGQKKRRLNDPIRKLYCSGVSKRRIAKLLRINRKTVPRKLIFLGEQATQYLKQAITDLHAKGTKLNAIQFDEMESFEHSKCLPLSIPLVVQPESRKILGFRVCLMPAKGPLAGISVKKYGRRADHRAVAASSLFEELKPIIHPRATIIHDHQRSSAIISDQNPKYPNWLKPHFPNATHKTHKGQRGCVVGQGELKKIGHDPLFDLNHTCAMIRANINRLFRRTWCTTKRADRLALHLAIYVQYHNEVLTSH